VITSEQTSLLSELRQKPIPAATLIELEARLQHRIHSLVLDAFNKSGLSQTELAERLGWDNARVSRCLGTSSNFTIKTISALLAALGVDLDDPTYTNFDELERRLKAHVSSTAAVSPAKKHRKESLSAGQLKLDFQRCQRSGATTTYIAPSPAGAVSHVSETMQSKPQGAKVIDLLKYRSTALGQQSLNVLQIGEANAR
jgi:transcriptional regulator with XRE-family HTH domain